MPSDFPRSPTLIRGALVAYDSPVLGVVPNVIVFQYNPEELTRSLRTRSVPWEYRPSGQAREDAFLTLGPPVESINLSVEIDAVDQLEGNNPLALTRGIQPALSALEILMYPKSTQLLLNLAAAAAGTWTLKIERTPLVLFVWGLARVLPVRISSFSIAEQAFDTSLNPIRAKVDLGLEVLSYLDLPEKDSVGRTAYMAMMVQREVLAGLNLANSTQNFLGGLIPL
jgi:hypothetical protein